MSERSIASRSSSLGDGVGLLDETLDRGGLEFLDPAGVLFSVGAAELYFERSMLELDLSRLSLSTSMNLTVMLLDEGSGDDIASRQVRPKNEMQECCVCLCHQRRRRPLSNTFWTGARIGSSVDGADKSSDLTRKTPRRAKPTADSQFSIDETREKAGKHSPHRGLIYRHTHTGRIAKRGSASSTSAKRGIVTTCST